MTHKTEIEIEMSETVAYSRPSERFETFCPTCKSLVEMATPQVAAILTHSNEREIYRLVETDEVHFVETDRVLVCLTSLTATLTDGKVQSEETSQTPLRETDRFRRRDRQEEAGIKSPKKGESL